MSEQQEIVRKANDGGQTIEGVHDWPLRKNCYAAYDVQHGVKSDAFQMVTNLIPRRIRKCDRMARRHV